MSLHLPAEQTTASGFCRSGFYLGSCGAPVLPLPGAVLGAILAQLVLQQRGAAQGGSLGSVREGYVL